MNEGQWVAALALLIFSAGVIVGWLGCFWAGGRRGDRPDDQRMVQRIKRKMDEIERGK